jgi:spore coat-associated protein N
MKKILGLTLAALVTIALIGGSTWAYFSDVETSADNSLTAGTLDLNIDGGNVAVTTFDISGQGPGDTGSGSSTLSNVGDFGGELDVTFSAITNVGGSGGTEFEDGSGDLGGVAELAAYIDVDQSGSWTSGDIGLKSDTTTYNHPTALDYDTFNSYANDDFDAVETLAASAADDLILLWSIPTGAGNNIQGDSASCNVTITLEQGAID